MIHPASEQGGVGAAWGTSKSREQHALSAWHSRPGIAIIRTFARTHQAAGLLADLFDFQGFAGDGSRDGNLLADEFGDFLGIGDGVYLITHHENR